MDALRSVQTPGEVVPTLPHSERSACDYKMQRKGSILSHLRLLMEEARAAGGDRRAASANPSSLKEKTPFIVAVCLRRQFAVFPLRPPQTGREGKYGVFFLANFGFCGSDQRTQMCTRTLLSGGLQGNRAERKLRAFAKQEPSGVMATVADYPTHHQSGRGEKEERRVEERRRRGGEMGKHTWLRGNVAKHTFIVLKV